MKNTLELNTYQSGKGSKAKRKTYDTKDYTKFLKDKVAISHSDKPSINRYGQTTLYLNRYARSVKPKVSGRDSEHSFFDFTQWGNTFSVEDIEDKSQVDPAVERRFYELASLWYNEIRFLSLASDMMANNLFSQICSYGLEIMPLLLIEVQHNPALWLPTIETIAEARGIDPFLSEDDRQKDRIIAVWLEWGKKEGYIK